MRLLPRRRRIPAILRDALTPDEHLLATARTADGRLLAATRFGLWIVAEGGVVDGDVAEEAGVADGVDGTDGDAADGDAAGAPTRWDWHLISKARLTGTTLSITVADVVDHWPDDITVMRDRPELALDLTVTTRLTDLVHDRVRRSVAASYHLDWPDAGGWVVLRKVPGHDGLASQLRLDAGADPDAAEFADAARSIRDQLWPATVPGPPGHGGG